MSNRLKQKLEQFALVLFFIAGAVILGIQIRKYFFEEVELTINELIVTLVAISLILNPRFLLNGFSKIIDSKYSKKGNGNTGENNDA